MVPRRSLAVSCALIIAANTAQAAPSDGPSVRLAPDITLELVATDLRTPRGVLPIDGGAYVLEFGGWDKNEGSLVRLTKTGSTWRKSTVLTKLDRPFGLVKGPDGKAYLGQVGRLDRFDLSTSNPPKLESVIKGLPGLGLHPLTAFAFTREGDLLVNVGSKTNNCEANKGRNACPEAEGDKAHGVLRRYRMRWPEGTVQGWSVEARGLRNSLGLAVHSSGTILQAENSRDSIDEADRSLSDETLPHDELNLIGAGKNYGWPYCFDARRNSPEFKRYDCTRTIAPIQLLPAHAAPLGMAYWNNELVLSYHGYRAAGHRLVAFPVDASGLPNGPSRDLIYGWEEVGDQSLGGPVGLAVAADNALWVVDDRNHLVLRLTRR